MTSQSIRHPALSSCVSFYVCVKQRKNSIAVVISRNVQFEIKNSRFNIMIVF